MEHVTFAHGDIIFREGEESDVAYVIDSGNVEIFKRVKGGTVLLSVLGAGDIFGEMGLMADLPRSASAAADGPVKARKLSRHSLNSVLRTQSPEVIITMKALMERLRETNQKLSKMVEKQSQFQIASDAPPPVKKVSLAPLTEVLKPQLGKGMIISLPFRVGALAEGAQDNPLDWNNLLIKGADHAIMSANHFAIQRGQNGVFVVDRGSRTGTIVNDVAIGGSQPQFQADLEPGENIVIAGDSLSPYRFSITWETE